MTQAVGLKRATNRLHIVPNYLIYSELNKEVCVKMPAGVSWPRYLRMFGASVLAMFAGAQVVHQYYLPDLSIPEVPPKPGELKTELQGYEARQIAVDAMRKQMEEQKVD